MPRPLRWFRGLLLGLLLLETAAAQTLHFAALGDSGTGDVGQRAIARQMEIQNEKQHWSFALMLGDNIYDRGSPQDFDRKFKSIYRNLRQAGVVFHATLGNHDMLGRNSRNGLAQVEDDDFGYVGHSDEYVFEAGPLVAGKVLARFICLDSPVWLGALQKDPKQLDPRMARLRAWLAESGRAHWNFLYMHHPMYSYTVSGGMALMTMRHGHGPEDALRAILEPEIKGKIDVVLGGHEHFYQKIRPQEGIHYFISGGGGKVRRGAVFRHPQVEFAAETLHFLDFELSSSELHYAAVSNRGAVIHSGVITRAD